MKKWENTFHTTIFIIIALLEISALPCPVFAKSINSKELMDKASLTSFVQSYYGKKPMESSGEMTISIVKNNSPLLRKGFLNGKESFHAENASYFLGSIAKTMTAIAVMQLVEKGKLNLQTDINNYVKDVKIENKFDNPVTLYNLLTHSSGFDNPRAPETEMNNCKLISLKPFLLKYQPSLVRKPGTSVMYDNYAFNLAGYIVEKVSGMEFNEYVTKNIFTPLGMYETTFNLNKQNEEKIAKGFDRHGNKFPFFYTVPQTMPTGGLISTSKDMEKFMTMMLNGGVYNNHSILSKDSFAQMMKEHFPMTGFGLDILHYKKYKVIRKVGQIGNFYSVFFLIPKEKIGIFISAAYDPENYTQFIEKFIDLFFAPKENDSIESKPISKLNTNRYDLNDLAGTYQDLRQSNSNFNKILRFFEPTPHISLTLPKKGIIVVNYYGHQREFHQISDMTFKEEYNETLGNHNLLTFFKEKDVIYLQMPEEQSFFKKVEKLPSVSLHQIWMVFLIGLLIVMIFISIKLIKRI
jgi:CubicO group peptidase (beta-lactamase class C family)